MLQHLSDHFPHTMHGDNTEVGKTQSMIISTHGLRPVKLVSVRNYLIRVNNKLEKPQAWMTHKNSHRM
jgi:hypothetical protein